MRKHKGLKAATVLSEAFLEACRADIEAIKPGNVGVHAPGHSMQADDFTRSASAVAKVFFGHS